MDLIYHGVGTSSVSADYFSPLQSGFPGSLFRPVHMDGVKVVDP